MNNMNNMELQKREFVKENCIRLWNEKRIDYNISFLLGLLLLLILAGIICGFFEEQMNYICEVLDDYFDGYLVFFFLFFPLFACSASVAHLQKKRLKREKEIAIQKYINNGFIIREAVCLVKWESYRKSIERQGNYYQIKIQFKDSLETQQVEVSMMQYNQISDNTPLFVTYLFQGSVMGYSNEIDQIIPY